ncbi:hypothetical protein JL721_3374 [Aureococcus anophagefferens]|nr:hypothetical protein JL721_3374 [Aureococcus anophagefferens]
MRLLRVLAFAAVVASTDEVYDFTAASADGFFDASAPSAAVVDGATVLSATTPLATACGAAFRVSGAGAFSLYFSEAMDPGTPSLDHDVALAAGESDGEVRFFAFLPFGRGVYVSATYAGGDGLVKTDAAAFASSGDAASDAADVAATATSDAVALALSDIGSAAAAGVLPRDARRAPFGEADSSGARHGIQRADAVAAAPSGALAAEPATTYAIGASWVDASLGVFHAAATTTTTPEAEDGSGDCASNNVALASAGASVAAVSSNYGGGSSSSSYGADKAIDGSDSSQWSSDGDGDGASITIALPSATDVVGVGFYSRSMTNSAVIQTYECADDADWFFKKKKRDCAWVSKKPAARCNEDAEAACAEACCSCDEDDASWFAKKATRDCAWVAKKKTKSRCKKKGRDGDGKRKKAKVACPVACCGW